MGWLAASWLLRFLFPQANTDQPTSTNQATTQASFNQPISPIQPSPTKQPLSPPTPVLHWTPKMFQRMIFCQGMEHWRVTGPTTPPSKLPAASQHFSQRACCQHSASPQTSAAGACPLKQPRDGASSTSPRSNILVWMYCF